MKRIVPPEEAQRLLDTPTSIPGSSDWDFAYVNTYLANFIDAGPDLAHTVIIRTNQVAELQRICGNKDRVIRQQEQQIKRLWAVMEGADEALTKFTGHSFIEEAVHNGHITPKDMEP